MGFLKGIPGGIFRGSFKGSFKESAGVPLRDLWGSMGVLKESDPLRDL